MSELQTNHVDGVAFYQLGEYDPEHPILVTGDGEFYQQLHEIMGWMVVYVTDPGGGFPSVLNHLNGLYPDAHVLLAADIASREQIQFYKKLARQFGADTIFPSFRDTRDKLRWVEKDGKVLTGDAVDAIPVAELPELVRFAVKSTFRHMAIEQSPKAVKRSILKQVKRKERLPGKPPPIPAPPANDDGKVINPGADFTLPRLLRDFVVLHGHGSGVFDDRRCEFMSVTDFRNSVGTQAANEFLNCNQRRVVFRRNVVFDPTRKTLPEGYINLFRGFDMRPRKGKCDLLLDVLYHLCEQNDEVYQWLLRWIAYPLQNPGAKMTTAVVIHGREGAGKNLFWTAVQRIYGDYASMITQNDLESSFNGWASRKLFVIGNEVVSRQEMFHKKGIMKNMITEPEWFINEKNIAPRREANHCNFVFFSNFLQPVTPDKDDRRYLVLWTPPKRDKAYYKAVANERDNGGAEALYRYLLDYDLGDFNEYTEPIMTQAKMDLVFLSMKSDERFVELWLEGELPVPCSPVLTSVLYESYKYWCRLEGEKFFVSATEFGTLLNKHELVNKVSNCWYIKGVSKVKGTFAIPFGYEPGENQARAKWLTDCNEAFLVAQNEWEGNK